VYSTGPSSTERDSALVHIGREPTGHASAESFGEGEPAVVRPFEDLRVGLDRQTSTRPASRTISASGPVGIGLGGRCRFRDWILSEWPGLTDGRADMERVRGRAVDGKNAAVRLQSIRAGYFYRPTFPCYCVFHEIEHRPCGGRM